MQPEQDKCSIKRRLASNKILLKEESDNEEQHKEKSHTKVTQNTHRRCVVMNCVVYCWECVVDAEMML